MPSNSKTKTVVYVTFTESGGMLHYAENISLAMRQFVDSRLISPSCWGETPIKRSFSEKMRTKYNPAYFRSIAERIILEHHPQLVHITSKTTGLVPFVSKLRQAGVQVVYTIHDPTVHDEHSTAWGKLVEYYHAQVASPWLLRACSATHLHSAVHAKEMLQVYGQEHSGKVYLVQHGGGATMAIASGTDLPNELASENMQFTFLFFGRIEPYKGINVLIAAFRQVLRNTPACRLVIAGAGALAPVDDLPDGCYIPINRFIADSEVRGLFEQADAVVLPYLSATQSGVIPLASQFARPVICSKTGALPEMVVEGRTGLLVPPGDIESLANAMQTMVANREATRAMGQAAKAYMAKTFSWDVVARHHHAKYTALFQSDHQPRLDDVLVESS